MLDNELIGLFLPIINSGLIAQGYTDVAVLQSAQPTQQGVPTGKAIFFYKVDDFQFAFLKRESTYDEINAQEVHTETQWYETTFQISGLFIQDPLTPTQSTASDLVNAVAATLRSDQTRAILKQHNVGINRTTTVRNPYFVDDKDRFEASPSFDFTLSHERQLVTIVPSTRTARLGIYRV